MKTKKSFLTILAVALVLISSATEKPKMNVQSLNSNQILLTVKSPEASVMETSIYNESGDIVYYKKSRKPISSMNKIFDVANLENGNYQIHLELNNQVLERDLTITSNKIFVSKARESFSPYFLYNGKELIITQLNFENENYQIKVYDNQGLVFKKAIGNKSTLHSVLDLSQLETGNYTVLLNSAKNKFSYQFAK